MVSVAFMTLFKIAEHVSPVYPAPQFNTRAKSFPKEERKEEDEIEAVVLQTAH